MNNLPSDFGLIIRRRRRALQVTQGVLADLSGVARHTVTDIESGKGNPTIEIMQRLLAPLGLRLAIEIAEPNPARPATHP